MIKNWLAGLGMLSLMPGMATAAETGIGLRASTLGAGAELSIGLLDRLVLRVPFNTFRYSDDITEDDIRYDGELQLRTVGLLADVHIFGGGFHLTGGLYSNGNEINLLASEATGNESFQVGDRSYRSDPNNPFELTAGLDFGSVAPYAGIGWGNAAQAENNGVYFKLELGVLFQGSPSAEANGSGSVCDVTSPDCTTTSFDVEGNDPRAAIFREELERERADLEAGLDDFKLYPVAGFSIGYRF